MSFTGILHATESKPNADSVTFLKEYIKKGRFTLKCISVQIIASELYSLL